MKRRDLLKHTGLLAGVPLLPLFPECENPRGGTPWGGYGPLLRREDALLWLPEGFEYVTFSGVGTRMSDGYRVPGAHDGMDAFAVPGRPERVRLVRNHELAGVEKAQGPDARSYDRRGPGAVTIVEWDMEKRHVVKEFLALSGTIENCSGGRRGNSWLTCEETTEGLAQGYSKRHGYVFEVPSDAKGLVEPVALKDMGRFTHEAAVTDPSTGFVYLTEDEGPDGFYRFIPNNPGDLRQGGSLWMLAVAGVPQYETGTAQTVGLQLPTEWVRIENPDPDNAEENASAVFEEGWNKGGASFLGLEGAGFAAGSVYFTASDGGDAERGQIWRFTPKGLRHGVLELVFESGNKNELDGPDNLTISPHGSILICEDGDGGDWIDGDDSCRVGGDNGMRFVTRAGAIFEFAKVNPTMDLVAVNLDDFEEDCTARPLPGIGEVFGASETTGPCFSPDGKWLFVNIQVPGITLAITGPWRKGAL